MLESLLPTSEKSGPEVSGQIKDFTLCCAALASAQSSTYIQLSWIPGSLSEEANSAFCELSRAFDKSDEAKLAIELMPEVLQYLKARIKESSIDTSDDVDQISAATARVSYPQLGKMSSLVIPCALTALDHWSPEVKGQGMISFIHLAKNVNAAELSWYEDVILDACCQNVAGSDEIWDYVVEMYEKLLNEMLSHLERQPRNKERRIAWLNHIELLLNGMGLVLLAHFKRIFPLFFQWMHADDDETVVLVLDQVKTVIKLTWIRNSPYIERCKGPQFEAAWSKHKDDPNLTALHPPLSGENAARECFYVLSQNFRPVVR
ncbi:hypothetical protein RJ640_023372 [Escallonia rubra]|uniref:ARM repeat superfamily protein n=1 Tax=Escallonia rubra TaxID=112253 RepID=A0AA88UPV2_9ASTE|nr:hypothetical protein RJ640_023372 [Escallonia rubra]